jgi:hypothetical protein
VAEQAEGDNVRLVVEDTDTAKLNDAQQKALVQSGYKQPQTFEAYFESNGKRIHDFKGGTATVSRKYELAQGQKANYLHIYYLSTAGALEKQITEYVDGWLRALLGHFSEFVIVYDETMENETGKIGTSASEEAEPEPTPAPTATPTPAPTATPTPAPVKITKADKAQAKLDINAGFKVTQTGRKVTVEWGKVDKADRYDIYAGYCGSGKAVKIKSVSGKKLSMSFSKLNDTKLDLTRNIKVYVVAYNTSTGKDKLINKTISAHIVGTKNKIFSNVAQIELKKTKYTVTEGKTFTIKAATVLVNPAKKALTDAHAPEFRYATTDKKVAKVDKTGTVTATGKGTCYIWLYARNGLGVKVRVKVK